MTSRQYAKRSRLMIEQDKRAANGSARQRITRLVPLEGARAAADDFAGSFLRQPQFLPNTPDFLRLQ